MGHVSVDLSARHVSLTPRLTVGVAAWSGGSVHVEEWFVAGGLGVAHPWERARWFFALGAAVDMGAIGQYALGKSAWAFAFNLSAQTTLGLRLFRGLSLALDAEPGLLFPRTQSGLGVRPNVNVVSLRQDAVGRARRRALPGTCDGSPQDAQSTAQR